MPFAALGEAVYTLITTPDEAGLLVGQAIALLAHPLRRRVLEVLTEEGTCNRDELAARLREDETMTTPEADQLDLHLHHTHLPKLANAQYVDYDPRNGDVALWKESEDVETELLAHE